MALTSQWYENYRYFNKHVLQKKHIVAYAICEVKYVYYQKYKANFIFNEMEIE